MSRRWALCLLWLALPACATPRELAAQLQNAGSSGGFNGVNQCWDKAHEAMGRRGAYDVTTDFVVAPGGRIEQALVDEVLDASSGRAAEGPEVETLRSCVETALNGSVIDGFSPSRPVAVTGYRFALRDGEGGLGAQEGSASVLLGPREDRCRGLFTYDPPRDPPALDRALEEARGDARNAENQDRKARALQRAYDVSLELIERFELEVERKDRPEASRDKIRNEIRRVEAVRDEIAQAIGC